MPQLFTIDQLREEDAVELANVGVLTDRNRRSGTFLLRDVLPLCCYSSADGMELLSIDAALQRYDWLREKYFWKAVRPDLDEVTLQCHSESIPRGFFIRVRKNVKIAVPTQAGLFVAHSNVTQNVHNIVILEDDSELKLISGCLTLRGVSTGSHFAVSEMYLGRNAKLTNTMLHRWGPKVRVRPRSGTIVGAGGQYMSNYVSLQPAKSIESNALTWLNGSGASAKYLTIILGSDGTTIDTGGEVYLNADDTSAELVHRGVCTGGHIFQKGLLVGNARCRAHVDCAGMVLDTKNSGFIESIPGLRGMHPEARMSHEASIGKIAPEQVEYLQARGMEEREAISMIIRGFLDTNIAGLGPELDARIAEIAELAGHGETR